MENVHESQTYQAMLSEVETIIATIQNDHDDLDQLVTRVERGYTLMRAMQQRLEQARGRLDELQRDFEQPKDTATSEVPS